jgi:hypothetical protein
MQTRSNCVYSTGITSGSEDRYRPISGRQPYIVPAGPRTYLYESTGDDYRLHVIQGSTGSLLRAAHSAAYSQFALLLMCSEDCRYGGLVVDMLLYMQWRVHYRAMAVNVILDSVVRVFRSGVW